jgi:hypothetical protein
MKRKLLYGFIGGALVLAVALAGCETPVEDVTVQSLAAPEKDSGPRYLEPTELPNLPANIQYIDNMEEAQTFVSEFVSKGLKPNELIINVNELTITGNSRAMKTETFDIDLATSQDLKWLIKYIEDYATLTGYARGTIIYDEDDYYPIDMTIDEQFKLELTKFEGFGYNTSGKCEGSAIADVHFDSQTDFNGEIEGDFSFILNLIGGSKGLKCSISADFVADVDDISTGEYSGVVNYSARIYTGENTVWFEYDGSYSI